MDYSPLGQALRVRRHPTVAELERLLRAALVDHRTKLSFGPLPDSVGIMRPMGDRRIIVVDPHRACLPTLVHELLHIVKNEELESWGQAEEAVTRAVEDLLERFINRSKARTEWWRETVKAKEESSEES